MQSKNALVRLKPDTTHYEGSSQRLRVAWPTQQRGVNRMLEPWRRSLTRLATSALVLACGTLLLASPQTDRKVAGKTWTVSRTPDGQPDLQGMWSNYDSTPFERLNAGEEFPRGPAVSTADWLVQDSPT